jgi:hypothetical protein
LSTEARPIKVINTALSNNMRANEIAIETAKTGNVTAEVAVMSIYCRKKCKPGSISSGNKKPSHQKAESADFLEENFQKTKKLFSEIEKRLEFKEIST